MAENHDTESKGEREIPKTEKADSCFTIMPFGGWYDRYYENVFRPAIEGAGLKPRRADDVYRPGTIVHDIWSYTKEAKVILADLSGRNPNVLYELGLAHAIAKPVILVAESLEDIPFDLRALRVIKYDKMAPNWGDILKQNITQAIKETLEAPLKSILPAFLEVEESKGTKKVSLQEKEMLEIRQELDLLKRELRRAPVIEYDQAQMIIEAFLRTDMHEAEIIEELTRMGIPVRQTIKWIKEIKDFMTAEFAGESTD